MIVVIRSVTVTTQYFKIKQDKMNFYFEKQNFASVNFRKKESSFYFYIYLTGSSTVPSVPLN